MPTGTIVKAVGGFYDVAPDDAPRRIVRCRARGVFRKENLIPLAGDRVRFTPIGAGEGWIETIEPRKNAFVRPPVANVDRILVVHSVAMPPLSRRAIDRMLVLAEARGVEGAIVLTKQDLLAELPDEERAEGERETAEAVRVYRSAGYPVVLASAPSGAGIEAVRRLLTGRITVLAGPSGVGKSTLLRALVPERAAAIAVGAVSARTARGRHTTRAVELLSAGGGWIADTPGFTALELDLSPEALGAAFPEFRPYAPACRYRGCLHEAEPGCAVRAAVESGAIDVLRYRHYLQFLAELKEREEKRYR
ncbi:MAG: Ribosome small subunit-stimulated GTPase EngC [Hydrogenibacillus schlegelii]|uniref:Small ribosomal subunit biogenesis GTPase RsgA n=1 Tax=Hydrogenibacillus schlegelii TaxID=1484 RepID=A0A2T5G9T3_HYDSH|nr:ribosome small subunit-dependent GTPase A [Hydrogenibacillus schlegelii]PTQ52939.1 MAG: Ribosome small subunit-stimulated GTPase EngC [Hydrogenibacillus schlegelii]